MKHIRCGIAICLGLLLLACGEFTPEKERNTAQKKPHYVEKITTARDSTHLMLNQRRELLNQAYGEIQSLPTDSLKLHFLGELSQTYLSLRDSLRFRATNSELLQVAYDQNFCYMLGRANDQLGLFFYKQGVLDSALYYYQNALENYKQLPIGPTNYFKRGRMLYEIGKIKRTNNDYLGAEASIVKAIKQFRKLDDNQWLYACYNMLGITANFLGDEDRALQYLVKAADYLEKADFPEKGAMQWVLQNNRAYVYLEEEAYAKAKAMYTPLLSNKALPEVIPELYAMVLTSRAYIYLKSEHNLNRAQVLLDQSIALNDSLNFWHDQSRAKHYYAQLLAARGDTLNAIRYVEASRALAQKTSVHENVLQALQLLFRLSPTQTATYVTDYYDIASELRQREYTNPEKFARIRLETEDLIAENRRLVRDQRKQRTIMAVLFGFMLVSIAVLLLLYLVRIAKSVLKK